MQPTSALRSKLALPVCRRSWQRVLVTIARLPRSYSSITSASKSKLAQSRFRARVAFGLTSFFAAFLAAAFFSAPGSGRSFIFASPHTAPAQHIWPPEPEDQQHLYCPSPNAAHLREVLHQRVVAHLVSLAHRGHRTVQRLRRQVANGHHLAL